MTNKFEFNRKYTPKPFSYIEYDIFKVLVIKDYGEKFIGTTLHSFSNKDEKCEPLRVTLTKEMYFDFKRVEKYETEYKRIAEQNAKKPSVKQTRQQKIGKEARKIYLELCKKFPNQVYSDTFNDPNSPFHEVRIRTVSWPNGSFQLTEKEFSK